MISIRRLVQWAAAAASLTPMLLYCAVLDTSTTVPSQNGPIVNSPAGSIEGRIEGELHVFKGIPYALPPVGSQRWKPPISVPRWKEVRKATDFGPACFQPRSKVPSIYSGEPMPMSEDCLSLNIWAPAAAHNAPVFFWIHGGSLVGGSGRDPAYNGTRLAGQGIIVVSINYRLGVFGYLAHPELSSESPRGLSGNYGLLDQIQALKWVHSNISAFGGDPANVTIAGESAGALSVMYLMAAPPAEESGTKLAAALHALNIAAMRAMDAATLTYTAPAAGFAPWGAIDGSILPRQLVDVFDRAEQASVPLLAGSNSGEIRSLRFLSPPPAANAAAYESIIRSQYGDLADEFLRLYPSANMQESIWATTRDALYSWTAQRLVRKQTAMGQQAFLYFFDHGYPAEDAAGLHGFHASELPYVFGTFDGTPPLWPKVPETPQETRLSDAMIGYWSSFARIGHPQAANEPDWPPFGSRGSYMDFQEGPVPLEHLLPGMYEFNEETFCRRRASGNLPWNWNVGLVSPKLPAQPAQCKQ